MKYTRATFIGVVLLATTMSGCGSGDRNATAPSAMPTPTLETPTPQEATLEPTVDPTSETPFDDPVDTPSPTAAVLSTGDSGRALNLPDVFKVEGEWQESRYDVADRAEIQGIGVELDRCRTAYEAKLELRLAHRFSRLTMNVGQANTSYSSDQTLVVAVITNGRQQDERRIPFDKVQGFQIDVRDVNAVEIRFWMEYNDRCSGSVIAVVEKLTVYA